MRKTNVVIWKDRDAWLGYLQHHPNCTAQGETLDDLEDHLRDLRTDLISSMIAKMFRQPQNSTVAAFMFCIGLALFVGTGLFLLLGYALAFGMENPRAPRPLHTKLIKMFSLSDMGIVTWPALLVLLWGIVLMVTGIGLIDAIRRWWSGARSNRRFPH